MIHERDLDYWPGGWAPETALDTDFFAKHIYDKLKPFIESGKVVVPYEANYLGLGVGFGIPEVSFAKRFKIPGDRVTFIDKQSSDHTKKYIDKQIRGVTHIKSGMYEHFARKVDKRYFFVTAFGIEYLTQYREQVERFIDAMVNRLEPNGIVAISMYSGPNMDRAWRKKGFDVLLGHDSPNCSIICQYKPKA